MPKSSYTRLILQVMTVYQLFTTIISNKIESQLKTKHELMGKQDTSYITNLEKKLILDIQHKNIDKVNISLDKEGKILGYKYYNYQKKFSIENSELQIIPQSFVHSTLFGSIKLTRVCDHTSK